MKWEICPADSKSPLITKRTLDSRNFALHPFPSDMQSDWKSCKQTKGRHKLPVATQSNHSQRRRQDGNTAGQMKDENQSNLSDKVMASLVLVAH